MTTPLYKTIEYYCRRCEIVDHNIYSNGIKCLIFVELDIQLITVTNEEVTVVGNFYYMGRSILIFHGTLQMIVKILGKIKNPHRLLKPSKATILASVARSI